jgi:hypothetical protein
MNIGDIHIRPNNKTSDDSYLIETRLCFVRCGVLLQEFDDFRRTNADFIANHGVLYNYSAPTAKLYIMIRANTRISCEFLLNFEISNTISKTHLTLDVSRDSANNLTKIKTVLRTLCSLLNYNKIAVENDAYDEITIESFFCEQVHNDIIGRIGRCTTCKIVKTSSCTRSASGENNLKIRNQIQEYKYKQLLKKRHERKTICNKTEDGEVTETEFEAEQLIKSVVSQTAPTKDALLASSQIKRKIPKILEDVIETKYEIKCKNNVQFTYIDGVLKITNGLDKRQHDDIANVVASYFEEEENMLGTKRKRVD